MPIALRGSSGTTHRRLGTLKLAIDALSCVSTNAASIDALVESFRGRVVDIQHDNVMIEISGTGRDAEAASTSVDSFDASALSYDHAVPIDPLVVERIEPELEHAMFRSIDSIGESTIRCTPADMFDISPSQLLQARYEQVGYLDATGTISCMDDRDTLLQRVRDVGRAARGSRRPDVLPASRARRRA